MRIALPALALTFLLGCDPGDALRVLRPEPPTAHERYAESLRTAGLDSTALGRDWLEASDSALRVPLVATLPAREIAVYTRDEARAVAYRLELRDGERLEATLRADGLPARIFLDLFEETGDTTRPFRHRASADSMTSIDSATTMLRLEHEIRRDGHYLIRLQPELLRSGRFELVLRIAPILAFPVEGHSNVAIMSFFGASRDAGARSHHGIDIFADRGTPVIAATAGTIRSTRPNTLGGNVVWLSDEARGQSLYYAHLDTVTAWRGQRVERGDTLGYVGNSGNARTTAPHLHFGIYRRGSGPVDPLPWVRLVTGAPPPLRADTGQLGHHGVSRVAALQLRRGPDRDSEPAGEVPREATVRVMAASADWYRVQLQDGTAGYLNATAVRLLD